MAGTLAARAAQMPVIAVPERDAETFASVADAVVPDLFAARNLLIFPS
jgi:hypothetical protein